MLNLTLLNSILYVPDRGFNIVKPMLNLTMLNFIIFNLLLYLFFQKLYVFFTLCLHIFKFLNLRFVFVKK